MDTRARAPQGIQSIEIGYRVLAGLAESGGAVSLTELANTLDMAPSKVHRYLTSMLRCGLAVQANANGNYDLGPSVLNLGLQALRRIDHHHIAYEETRSLGAELDQTVFISVWSDNAPVVIAWHDTGRPIAIVARPGGKLSPVYSGTGRVFLAYRGQQEAKRIFQQENEPENPPSVGGKPLDKDGFLQLLRQIRERRMSRVSGDLVSSVDALSAPIFDLSGSVVFALSVVANHGDLDVDWQGSPARALAAATKRLSARFGWTE